MRFAIFTIFFLGNIGITSCKKNNDNQNVSNTDSLNQSVVYKRVATIPSPADCAKGSFRDSLTVIRITYKNDPDFFSNIPGISSNISKIANGFSFGYNNSNNSLPYFMFSAEAFPDVPRQFLLNNAYTHKSARVTQPSIFLGSSDGFDGMTYFVNNIYPPDANTSTNITYSSVSFNKLIKIPLPYSVDSAYFASGHISGYCIDYYGSDTTKYVQRWDFTVDFRDLLIDP